VCDTFVALPDVTLDGELIFGKNSDRPGGEVQDVMSFPAQRHAAGDTLQCTYLQITQARQTFAVVLSKPRWTGLLNPSHKLGCWAWTCCAWGWSAGQRPARRCS